MELGVFLKHVDETRKLGVLIPHLIGCFKVILV